MADPKFFSVKITGTGRLADAQFRDMITNFTSRSERGLFKESFRDGDPEGPLYWRTFGHDWSEKAVEDCLFYLKYFTVPYFRDSGTPRPCLEDYITFEVVLDDGTP